MQRFRRAISFRRSQRHIPESCRPHQWESDSHKVKSGGISFSVKYLGAQEVTESRGTQICSEAAKILKKNKRRRRSRKMTLLVTEDCIRVVDDKTKQLVIDQTIEKVSFCTPDPYNEKLFCYISRDGTSRRWMCQCFSARRDTGERLSHAVGCAFTACLQRKQKQVALKEQHFERQASMRGPTNKEKSAGEIGTVLAGSQLDTASTTQPGSTSADPSTQPSTPSVSSNQGSPPASLSSSPTHVTVPPAPLEATENQPIRKKEKKLNLQSRPRPQGVNANPFTRHTSLRYRSQPLSLQPLKPGKYEMLTDDQAVLPRLPPSPPETTAQPNKPTDIDTLLSMQDPVPATNTWNSTSTGTAQGTTGKQWQASGGNSAGLPTANQNSQAAGLQSNSWSNDLKIQPANKQANPFQVNGDDFGSLATRHQTTESEGNNPFKTQEPVRWL